MTDRRAGIAIGLVLGIAAIVLFVFVLSDDTVDDAEVDETTTQAKTSEPTQTTTTENEPAAEEPAEEKKSGDDADGGTEAPANEPPPLTIEVEGGQPVGGVQTIETGKGAEVYFRVRADAPEHVHVHGYDLFEDVAPGKPATFKFNADIDGIFEIELEDSAVQIAELRVNP